MKIRSINAPEVQAPMGGYAGLCEVTGVQRLAFVSGQIPAHADGSVPSDFLSQARLAWANVEAQLRAAGMTLDNLVKVTTFLSDRQYNLQNRQVRQEVLGRSHAGIDGDHHRHFRQRVAAGDRSHRRGVRSRSLDSSRLRPILRASCIRTTYSSAPCIMQAARSRARSPGSKTLLGASGSGRS
jgi:enamine deaminase RidA (YjgF/YER057c/UK114 family)